MIILRCIIGNIVGSLEYYREYYRQYYTDYFKLLFFIGSSIATGHNTLININHTKLDRANIYWDVFYVLCHFQEVGYHGSPQLLNRMFKQFLFLYYTSQPFQQINRKRSDPKMIWSVLTHTKKCFARMLEKQ